MQHARVAALNDVALADLQACKWEALMLTDDSRVLTVSTCRADGAIVAHMLQMPFDSTKLGDELDVSKMHSFGVSALSSLACGTGLNFALTVDGRLLSWTRNGSSGAVSVPVEVALPQQQLFASSVATGARIWACAVDSGLVVDGALVATQVDFSSIRCGYQHVLAITGKPRGLDYINDILALRAAEGDTVLQCRNGTVSWYVCGCV